MNITYSEIMNQYAALTKTYDYLSDKKDKIIGFFKSKKPKSLTYTGCGSSYCLCKSGEFSARLRLGIPSAAVASGDLMLNYHKYKNMLDGTMLIVPSRSGSTSEVVNAVQSVKSLTGAAILSICCVQNSDLSKLSDLTLEMPWAFDESVCQTRTVTNLYTANLLILAYLSGDELLEQSIKKAIEIGNNFINTYKDKLKAIAVEEWKNVVILADGEMQGIAAEAAIAFTEIAEIPGIHHHVLDVRHGPMVLVNKATLAVVCLTSDGLAYQRDLVNDLIKRGAAVITYSSNPMEKIPGVKLHVTSGTELDDAVRGIPFVFISQALAFYKSEIRGTDPDKPDGLNAWIKL